MLFTTKSLKDTFNGSQAATEMHTAKVECVARLRVGA